jgi:hypothetical protein
MYKEQSITRITKKDSHDFWSCKVGIPCWELSFAPTQANAAQFREQRGMGNGHELEKNSTCFEFSVKHHK